MGVNRRVAGLRTSQGEEKEKNDWQGNEIMPFVTTWMDPEMIISKVN